MKRRVIATVLTAIVVVGIGLSTTMSLAQRPDLQFQIVTGTSFANAELAAREAESSLARAVEAGCMPIGIGAGTGLGGELSISHAVHVLVECP